MVMLAAAWLLVFNTVGAHAGELVIATVNTPQMLVLQALTPQFERANPGLKVRWVTLEEGALRQRVSAEVASGSSAYDVVTIGNFEAPEWGRRGWLLPITPSPGYDAEDLLPAVREGLSQGGRLYAAPFYGESSLLMVRRDLAAKAGVRYEAQPTWAQVREAAARMHKPEAGVYGICLRGKPGWGENMALISTMVNSHGGQWFNSDWQPQLDSKPWRDALALYVDLLRNYGPPDTINKGYVENLKLFSQGHCAQWVDASSAASVLADPRLSQVAAAVGYLQAPIAVTRKGSHWLWTWGLAIPKGSLQAADAQRFVSWATSRDYVRLVGRERGWIAVPSGTRRSTYMQPEFLRAAPFAAVEKQALDSADPIDSTLPPSPYTGIQFVAIPAFPALGDAVGQEVAAALAGSISIDQALKAAQAIALRELRKDSARTARATETIANQPHP